MSTSCSGPPGMLKHRPSKCSDLIRRGKSSPDQLILVLKPLFLTRSATTDLECNFCRPANFASTRGKCWNITKQLTVHFWGSTSQNDMAKTCKSSLRKKSVKHIKHSYQLFHSYKNTDLHAFAKTCGHWRRKPRDSRPSDTHITSVSQFKQLLTRKVSGSFRLGTWSLKDLSFGKMSRRNHTWYWTKYKQPHFHVTCEIRCRSKSVQRLLISSEHLWKSSRRHPQTTSEMSQRIAETNFEWDNDATKFVKSSTLLQVTEASYSAALDCATKCHPLETWAAARSQRTGKNESTPT